VVGVSLSVDLGAPPQPEKRIPQMIKKPVKREIIGVFIFLKVILPKLLGFTLDKTQKYYFYFSKHQIITGDFTGRAT
jgi:hypothetical protein